MPDTITGCPEHLQPALDAARKRWAMQRGTVSTSDWRPEQAAEVLEFAAAGFSSRGWGEPEHLAAAQLGAWLAETALREDAERRAARNAFTHAAGLTLTPEEVQLVLAARARR